MREDYVLHLVTFDALIKIFNSLKSFDNFKNAKRDQESNCFMFYSWLCVWTRKITALLGSGSI